MIKLCCTATLLAFTGIATFYKLQIVESHQQCHVTELRLLTKGCSLVLILAVLLIIVVPLLFLVAECPFALSHPHRHTHLTPCIPPPPIPQTPCRSVPELFLRCSLQKLLHSCCFARNSAQVFLVLLKVGCTYADRGCGKRGHHPAGKH